ncbi:hypothetical protein ARMGADRAFT_690643 [Armillaria gallica]|uniref:Secreted protein n=1 Tax=Armillaria gallica TaxID=47427 RepID=A0A2H3E6S7_ARMGA|nr:hypothetical protein ARMGADRAFT_690643 [Armillaria gallica]
MSFLSCFPALLCIHLTSRYTLYKPTVASEVSVPLTPVNYCFNVHISASTNRLFPVLHLSWSARTYHEFWSTRNLCISVRERQVA